MALNPSNSSNLEQLALNGLIIETALLSNCLPRGAVKKNRSNFRRTMELLAL